MRITNSDAAGTILLDMLPFEYLPVRKLCYMSEFDLRKFPKENLARRTNVKRQEKY